MKVAVVGATGLVGSTILSVLAQRNFPATELIPVASEKSIGKDLIFRNKTHKVVSIEEAIAQKPSLALFSAGSALSIKYAPLFADAGATVIDNSSAWRMDISKKLIVPEVNAHTLTAEDKIIANPNCSTIQMVVALKPLHDRYFINRIVVSTYQSVTGTGAKAVQQLYDERAGKKDGEKVYPYPIDLNVLPHIDTFLENGYTKEEMKMVNETIKIMGDESIRVTATTVRVPVIGGHSESVNVAFDHEFDLLDIIRILKKSPGVVVQDDVEHSIYPLPISAHGKDEVFVGRIRRDETQSKTLNMWIVADNLRKGAATNAIQIAEYLIQQNWLAH